MAKRNKGELSTTKKSELSTAYWIVKSNALNEVRHTKMTVSQTRLFSIYLSKINPKDIKTREVTIKLDEYAKIMQFQRFNITQLKESATDLTKLTIHYCETNADGGFTVTSSLLFKQFRLRKNDNEEWVVDINCHDDVLHLMFELKKYFFKYQLWNSLQLNGQNQIRMYELLKQYEYAGAREISIKDLRAFLALKENEYKDWNNFRRRILEASQEALLKYSDIKFTWEVTGKRGRGGKINALKFNIEKNDDYERQFTFDEFLIEQNQPVFEGDTEEFEETGDRYYDRITLFMEACDNAFSREETENLSALMLEKKPHVFHDDIKTYNYFRRKYKELLMNNKKNGGIRHKYKYMCSLIGTD
jgi:plasmid replication initiation protein